MACADPAETPSAALPDPPLDAEEAEEEKPAQEKGAAAVATAPDPAAQAAAIARMVGLSLAPLRQLGNRN